MTTDTAPTTGLAAGVPFLAVPPETGARDAAPVVVAWHLADPPRTEAAFAAALPLAGLDAWRIYLGLPLTGSRLPPGGWDEVMRLGYADAVLNLQGPTAEGALAEFGAAFAALRDRFGFGAGPVGLLGGSIGAAVAQLVLAEGTVDARAAVLVSPLVRLRPVIEANEVRCGLVYSWSDASDAVARRLDFVARADEIAAHGEPAVLLTVGSEDDEAGFAVPARQLRDALAGRYADPSRVALTTIPGTGHALAEAPGDEPAPQTAGAAEVDRQAVAWFRRHLLP